MDSEVQEAPESPPEVENGKKIEKMKKFDEKEEKIEKMEKFEEKEENIEKMEKFDEKEEKFEEKEEKMEIEKAIISESVEAENALSGDEIAPESFKKPALIGPRRGKITQLRTVSGRESLPESKEKVEKLPPPLPPPPPEKTPENRETAGGEKQIPLQYKEPAWSGSPDQGYRLEVLKSGVILETVELGGKSFHLIGRLPTCDLALAHPTISRHHAILQYRNCGDEKNSRGFYLYDMGSTHGSFWNGRRIRPNVYVRLRGGHMLKFGCSQRKFILQAPPDDLEEESELSVTEIKEKRRLELLERERAKLEEKEREEEAEKARLEREEREGVDWGMGEDADEESDLAENPYAITNNEELFLDDPKKTLRGWFEREGHELQYETEEKGIGQFLCWVNLPLDGPGGRTVRAEALVKGKKKESVVQCALEACRILDRHGILRQATHEARKRKTRNWEEEDFYDSDEDNFLDRTGNVEKKREQRMRQAGKLEEKVETFASLVEKHESLTKRISEIENRLKSSEELTKGASKSPDEDDLDAFMSSLNTKILSKSEVTRLRQELQTLRKEEETLKKLVDITRPANLPSLKSKKIDESVRESKKKRAKEPEILENLKIQKTVEEPKKPDFPVQELEKSPGKPAIPEEAPENSEETEKSSSEMEMAKKRKKNMKRMLQRAEKATKVETSKSYGGDSYSEDYSMWLPPENQSGDGKTNLNEKFGY